MNLRIRTPLNADHDSFTRKDVVADKPHDPAPEHIAGGRYRGDQRSHEQVWPERRAEKMTQFASRVIKFLEPIGYVGPMADAMDLRDMTATQCIVHKREHRMGPECVTADLAPEWLRLQANNVDCVSMYSTYMDADGDEHPLSDDADETCAIAERLASEVIGAQLDANIEEFVRQNDRAFWYTGRPKVAVAVADANGAYGVARKPNHPWTEPELKAIAKRLPSYEAVRATVLRRESAEWKKRRSLQGVRALLTPAEIAAARLWERDRRWLETKGEVAETTGEDYDEPQEAYINTLQCPNCLDGQVEDLENGTLDDCPVCQGSATVLQTLGFEGIPVAEPLEDAQEPHEPPAIPFIDYVTGHMAP